MLGNKTERTVLEIRAPLKQAVVHLSSNSSRIRSIWRKLLDRYEPCAQYASLLAGLQLALRLRDLGMTNPRAYHEESERQGLELARRGVPPECAIAAVALFLESCLPYVHLVGEKAGRWTRSLARWASVYQFFLLSGYSQHRATELSTMSEKVSLAEKRAQDFSIELGNAYEKERRRLAQDLHDEIGHDLIVLKLYTQVIALDLKKGDLGPLRHKLKESVSLIKHALKGVRHLTFDLGPAIWSEQGFIPAVRMYVRQLATRTGLRVRFTAAGLKTKLPARYETALYKVLQGAISNVAAHAQAQHVKISLASRRDSVVMRIEDDGKGFQVGRKLSAPPHSYGLRAMRDRIELLGGSIHFSSRPSRRRIEGRGTIIEFHLPLHESEAT